GLFLTGVLARRASFVFRSKGVLAMNRKLISLAGVLVAVVGFTVGSTDAEARHCRHRSRCCQQSCAQQSCGQQSCNTGCQPNANNGYQQTSNYAPGQVTYDATGTTIDAGQQTPAAPAPVPNN
ncbi:MAG: hypothetical protein AABP62_08050, partial [Planctomycetota bacterium]